MAMPLTTQTLDMLHRRVVRSLECRVGGSRAAGFTRAERRANRLRETFVQRLKAMVTSLSLVAYFTALGDELQGAGRWESGAAHQRSALHALIDTARHGMALTSISCTLSEAPDHAMIAARAAVVLSLRDTLLPLILQRQWVKFEQAVDQWFTA